MTIKATATLIYGILIAVGGIMGWKMAGSLASLIAGGGLGLLAIIGAVLMFMGKPAGTPIAMVAATLVGLFFAYQLVKGLGVEGANLGRPIGVIVLSLIEIGILLLVKSPSSGG